jgi:hypothetical protein
MKARTVKKLTLVFAAALVPMLFAQTCTVTLPRGYGGGWGPYYDSYGYNDLYFDVGYDTYYDGYYYDDYYYDDYSCGDYCGGGFFDWFGW